MGKIYKTLRLASLLFLSLMGCQKNQDEYFTDSSSARMTAYLESARDVLSEARYGWIMPYYYDRGGETLCLSFTKDSVYVQTTDSRDKTPDKGVYSLNGSSGPVLSFDSYINSFHRYATPASDRYLANKGDFEFLMRKVEPSGVLLLGLHWDQPSWLIPLQKPAGEYLESVAYIRQNLLKKGKYVGMLEDMPVRLSFFERGVYKEATFTQEEGVSSTFRYTYLDSCLFFPELVSLGNLQFDSLSWDETTHSLRTDGLILTYEE